MPMRQPNQIFSSWAPRRIIPKLDPVGRTEAEPATATKFFCAMAAVQKTKRAIVEIFMSGMHILVFATRLLWS